jgi:hypothetical protein
MTEWFKASELSESRGLKPMAQDATAEDRRGE